MWLSAKSKINPLSQFMHNVHERRKEVSNGQWHRTLNRGSNTNKSIEFNMETCSDTLVLDVS